MIDSIAFIVLWGFMATFFVAIFILPAMLPGLVTEWKKKYRCPDCNQEVEAYQRQVCPSCGHDAERKWEESIERKIQTSDWYKLNVWKTEIK